MIVNMDFVDSILSLRGVDGSPFDEHFIAAIVDVLILATMDDAKAIGADFEDRLTEVVGTIAERAAGWESNFQGGSIN